MNTEIDQALESLVRQEPDTKARYIILYIKGGRVGSFPFEYKEELNRIFNKQVDQIDANGTEHWDIFGIRG